MSKILIVDEAEIFLQLERSFLRRIGFSLHVAGGPEDLLEKAIQHRPDLILLHSRGQEERCGTPCALRLKADPRTSRIPIILIHPPRVGGDRASFTCECLLEEPLCGDSLLTAISSLIQVSSRIQPRVPASLSAALRSGTSVLRGRTKDLSSTGVFIQTRRPLETGLRVGVEVVLPAGRGTSVLTARGRVVRDVQDDPSSYLLPGNAVHLEDLDGGAARLLDEFIGRRGAAL